KAWKSDNSLIDKVILDYYNKRTQNCQPFPRFDGDFWRNEAWNTVLHFSPARARRLPAWARICTKIRRRPGWFLRKPARGQGWTLRSSALTATRRRSPARRTA